MQQMKMLLLQMKSLLLRFLLIFVMIISICLLQISLINQKWPDLLMSFPGLLHLTVKHNLAAKPLDSCIKTKITEKIEEFLGKYKIFIRSSWKIRKINCLWNSLAKKYQAPLGETMLPKGYAPLKFQKSTAHR